MSYQGRQEAGTHQEVEHVLPSLEESRWDRRNAMLLARTVYSHIFSPFACFEITPVKSGPMLQIRSSIYAVENDACHLLSAWTYVRTCCGHLLCVYSFVCVTWAWPAHLFDSLSASETGPSQ